MDARDAEACRRLASIDFVVLQEVAVRAPEVARAYQMLTQQRGGERELIRFNSIENFQVFPRIDQHSDGFLGSMMSARQSSAEIRRRSA